MVVTRENWPMEADNNKEMWEMWEEAGTFQFFPGGGTILTDFQGRGKNMKKNNFVGINTK